VARRSSTHRANGTACGRAWLDVGTRSESASVRRIVVRDLDSQVLSQDLGSWGCPRIFTAPHRGCRGTAGHSTKI